MASYDVTITDYHRLIDSVGQMIIVCDKCVDKASRTAEYDRRVMWHGTPMDVECDLCSA